MDCLDWLYGLFIKLCWFCINFRKLKNLLKILSDKSRARVFVDKIIQGVYFCFIFFLQFKDLVFVLITI